ncbi:unnamed protein product [Rhodiola kirilowii]
MDIRKWFVKPHGKVAGSVPKPENSTPAGAMQPSRSEPVEDSAQVGDDKSRRKTSKYFAGIQNSTHGKEVMELPAKRKAERGIVENPAKKVHIVDDDDDDDFVPPKQKKNVGKSSPIRKVRNEKGRAAAQEPAPINQSDEDCLDVNETPIKASGRGRGGRGKRGGRNTAAAMEIDDDLENTENKNSSAPSSSGARGRGGRGAAGAPAGGRGRGGGGRGGFMSFGERKDPPHKGEKEIPEGTSDCLAGLTFVISGTLDSLEREEAEDLIKRHGGRVTGSVSKKTNYLLCDEDIGGRKSEKAKEVGTAFLTEDGLFDMIRASSHSKVSTSQQEQKKTVPKATVVAPPSTSTQKEAKDDGETKASFKTMPSKALTSTSSPVKKKIPTSNQASLTWTDKYRPKVPNDIIGNQSLVKQIHDWLTHWHENFLLSGNKKKGKSQNDSANKKAILLCGTPGIGKTTSAKLVSQMLGFQIFEVNASDSRGKADSHINRGIGGSTANSVKELVSNEALSANMDWSKHPKSVLIMDEVDGMSAGDRGGVADLIASIKVSKIPIICICNDRYSQKLKSLLNYCLVLTFRKPTKQQMAKRFMQVASAEGLNADEIALEELAERVNGDMRMALNQLQYMSLSMSVIKYDDIRKRLLSSSKDEDTSPFTAVDKLLGYNGGKLRMDERIDLSMSDPDLVPLLVQENYINYRPSLAGKDDDGLKRLSLIARAAESIGDGDIFNVQIRRYRQWQLSQASVLSSCIIPAGLLHGQREILEPGERNFNRFGGWLGKNSTIRKNFRLLEDLHYHILASGTSNLGRSTLRLDYLMLLLKQLTDPLKMLPKDEAVEKVVSFLSCYSISMEDYDTIVELSKYQKHPNPLEGIQAPVKAALTKAYKQNKSLIRVADMITIPGMKKAPKKRVAAILEPAEDELADEKVSTLVDSDNESSSDTEDGTEAKQLQMDIQNLNIKGMEVQVDFKDSKTSKTKKPAAGRGRGTTSANKKDAVAEKKAGRGSGAAAKRKR